MSIRKEVRKEFQSYALNPEGHAALNELAAIFTVTLDLIEKTGVTGRPLALVITKLQEAKMWSVRGIAENRDFQLEQPPTSER